MITYQNGQTNFAEKIFPKLCRNCAFLQNFHTTLGGISVFYAVCLIEIPKTLKDFRLLMYLKFLTNILFSMYLFLEAIEMINPRYLDR